MCIYDICRYDYGVAVKERVNSVFADTKFEDLQIDYVYIVCDAGKGSFSQKY